jgi:Xaa-Pro aminopeptidase
LTDFRYTEQASRQALGVTVVEIKELVKELAELLFRLKIRFVGVEGDHLTVSRLHQLKAGLAPIDLAPLSGMVELVRLIKDETEIEAMVTLTTMLETVFPQALAMIRPGAVERDIAVEIEYLLRKQGADGPAFDFIVASGVRSAMPHGVASDKVIASGELVTLDWGAKGYGYHTDNTRTVAVGEVDEELRRIYALVAEANSAAITAIRPGVTVRQIDDAARRIITEAGYGDRFGHGTGHGVGLDIHEKPSVTWRDGTVVTPGMVFTIEPGIYLPGKGGVRIEDMALVTETGGMVFSERIPKKFITLS